VRNEVIQLRRAGPDKRITLHRPAFDVDCSAGGAQAHMVDARAAIFLTTLDAACSMCPAMGSAADGADRGAARTNQLMTDEALLQIAHADKVPTVRHVHAVFSTDAAVTDNAASHAVATSAAAAGIAHRNFVRQCMADRAFL
jgi:hypothetical protein